MLESIKPMKERVNWDNWDNSKKINEWKTEVDFRISMMEFYHVTEYIAYAGIDFYFNIFFKFNIDSFGVSTFVAN